MDAEKSSYRKKLAAALQRAKAAARAGSADVLRTRDLSRADRELLLSAGWLQEILRGWFLLARPDIAPGDSTVWYAHFWPFLRIYLKEHHRSDYCLSAETSLLLHTQDTTIPEQVVVLVKKGGGRVVELPFDTSLYPYADPRGIPSDVVRVNGLQSMSLPLALCRVSPQFYHSSPREAGIALAQLESPADIVNIALAYGLQRGVGRVIGALDALGRSEDAQAIRDGIASYGISRKEENPFIKPPLVAQKPAHSPHAGRIALLWERYRQAIIDELGTPPSLAVPRGKYLADVDHIYKQDAYHSLSIEGYRVSPELIERVENHGWDPTVDFSERDALAARGYYEAFQSVKESIAAILEGGDPVHRLRRDLPGWYSSLWAPSVRAGILDIHHVRGYRRGPVFIRGSRHVPPPSEALLDSMDMFFRCLETEEHPGVRAILGHYIFVFIHPYPDGNGRIARFLMNAMLASGGYSWTVIHVENCRTYIDALEHTTLKDDIGPFAQFVHREMRR